MARTTHPDNFGVQAVFTLQAATGIILSNFTPLHRLNKIGGEEGGGGGFVVVYVRFSVRVYLLLNQFPFDFEILRHRSRGNLIFVYIVAIYAVRYMDFT
jgi:hypothetical protein